MLSDFLKNIKSQAKFVKMGYGQVEPNHLSAQATKEVYAQLPADPEIKILENGQFAKYDYAKNVVDFDGPGEWLLVFNEIKLYREGQMDCEFAMLKDNYQARVYSPYDWERGENLWQARFYGPSYHKMDAETGEMTFEEEGNPARVTAAADPYEPHYNEDPFKLWDAYKERMMDQMAEGATMVPRLLKTHIGDIYTTNMVDEEELALEDELSPRADDGILCKSGDESIVWQVVRVYTMPDGQPGVKLMRIK